MACSRFQGQSVGEAIIPIQPKFHVCVLVRSTSLWLHGLWPFRLLSPWDFPGKNTGVDCHLLLQGFSQPRSLPLQTDSLPSEWPGNPRVLTAETFCLLNPLAFYIYILSIVLWLALSPFSFLPEICIYLHVCIHISMYVLLY